MHFFMIESAIMPWLALQLAVATIILLMTRAFFSLAAPAAVVDAGGGLGEPAPLHVAAATPPKAPSPRGSSFGAASMTDAIVPLVGVRIVLDSRGDQGGGGGVFARCECRVGS